VSLEQIMNEFLGLKTIGLIVSSNVHPFIWYNKINPHDLDPLEAQGFVFMCDGFG